LAGNVPMREPWPSEDEFFRARPEVAGLAADDNCVVVNPHSPLSESEKKCVALNEAARVVMGRDKLTPTFDLTPEQYRAFANYGPIEAIKATIAARLLSGDPSALAPTVEQLRFVKRLAKRMGMS